ncbi:hypothetical protein GCM10023196_036660 [Actinoallomurus vinaceus]|uniref:HEXXH motif domain-containing protein n=1 Tax=Actinoallomurus vinaceus TaxID=1080074 RepID=A0ABP8U957_9ACTN
MTTTAAVRLPLTELGGMPLIDDGFVPGRLLAALAAARSVRARRLALVTGADPDPLRWVRPQEAIRLRDDPPLIPSLPLTPSEERKVAAVLDEAADLVPVWRPLLALPIQYLLYHPDGGAASASAVMWPQHILLAKVAFTTPATLREQVIHELCHQWLYAIQELWPLEATDPPPRVALPSGTPNRSPGEVIGAAHVMAALLRLHRADPARPSVFDAPHERHIAGLAAYARGCFQTLDSLQEHLTPAGLQITRRLKEAI